MPVRLVLVKNCESDEDDDRTNDDDGEHNSKGEVDEYLPLLFLSFCLCGIWVRRISSAAEEETGVADVVEYN